MHKIFTLYYLLSQRTRIREEPHVHQRDRELTADERVKMDKSALLNELERMNKLLNEKETQLKDTLEELESSKNKLETLGQELQDKKRQLQDKTIILEQQKTELAEKNKQLEEKESLLTDRETQLMERDQQLQEKDRLLEEKNTQIENMNRLLEEKTKHLQEQTDPESSAHEEMSGVSQDSAAPIRKRKSMEGIRPRLSEESP
ncbi:hypothetical protein AMELA_G00059500 [Ameiurus melas]|uniref:Uncharacterized protein n=1 Tax=Ameiurus melas TaxID=219545 RepID=A0A7J6B1K4_AMEME|nr:hypothetical protein AMELA_G00059500 [Ameiurus melas]